MINEKVTFIESNFAIEKKIKGISHPAAIYKYRKYWWKETNGDQTIRYDCSETKTQKCTSNIKINDDTVISETGYHFCQMLDEADIEFMKAEQELKKMVTSNISKTIRACYNDTGIRYLEVHQNL